MALRQEYDVVYNISVSDSGAGKVLEKFSRDAEEIAKHVTNVFKGIGEQSTADVPTLIGQADALKELASAYGTFITKYKAASQPEAIIKNWDAGMKAHVDAVQKHTQNAFAEIQEGIKKLKIPDMTIGLSITPESVQNAINEAVKNKKPVIEVALQVGEAEGALQGLESKYNQLKEKIEKNAIQITAKQAQENLNQAVSKMQPSKSAKTISLSTSFSKSESNKALKDMIESLNKKASSTSSRITLSVNIPLKSTRELLTQRIGELQSTANNHGLVLPVTFSTGDHVSNLEKIAATMQKAASAFSVKINTILAPGDTVKQLTADIAKLQKLADTKKILISQRISPENDAEYDLATIIAELQRQADAKPLVLTPKMTVHNNALEEVNTIMKELQERVAGQNIPLRLSLKHNLSVEKLQEIVSKIQKSADEKQIEFYVELKSSTLKQIREKINEIHAKYKEEVAKKHLAFQTTLEPSGTIENDINALNRRYQEYANATSISLSAKLETPDTGKAKAIIDKVAEKYRSEANKAGISIATTLKAPKAYKSEVEVAAKQYQQSASQRFITFTTQLKAQDTKQVQSNIDSAAEVYQKIANKKNIKVHLAADISASEQDVSEAAQKLQEKVNKHRVLFSSGIKSPDFTKKDNSVATVLKEYQKEAKKSIVTFAANLKFDTTKAFEDAKTFVQDIKDFIKKQELKLSLRIQVGDAIRKLRDQVNSVSEYAKNKEVTVKINADTGEAQKKIKNLTDRARSVTFDPTRTSASSSKSHPRASQNTTITHQYQGRQRGFYEKFRSAVYPFTGQTSVGASTPLAMDMAKGMGLMYATDGLMRMVTDSFKQVTEYEHMMKTVKSILQTNDRSLNFEGQFSDMQNIVRSVGRETKFTAPEVAGAARFMAMAGLNMEDIKATIRPVANLALVGDNDIAEAADKVTNIVTAFGLLKGKDARQKQATMSHASDILTNTFTKSNTDLMQLAEAMQYAGPMSHLMGTSLEDTAAMIGVMGNAGIQSSMAGTTLRMMYQNIIKPSKQQSKEWERLGINRFDENGRVRNILDILVDLRAKLTGTTDLNKKVDAEQLKTVGAGVMNLFRTTAGAGTATILENLGQVISLANSNRSANGIAATIAEDKKNSISGLWAQVTSTFTDQSVSTVTEFQKVLKEMLANLRDWLASEDAANTLRNIYEMGKHVLEIFGAFANVWKELLNFGSPILKHFITFQFGLSQLGHILSAFSQVFSVVPHLTGKIGSILGAGGAAEAAGGIGVAGGILGAFMDSGSPLERYAERAGGETVNTSRGTKTPWDTPARLYLNPALRNSDLSENGRRQVEVRNAKRTPDIYGYLESLGQIKNRELKGYTSATPNTPLAGVMFGRYAMVVAAERMAEKFFARHGENFRVREFNKMMHDNGYKNLVPDLQDQAMRVIETPWVHSRRAYHVAPQDRPNLTVKDQIVAGKRYRFYRDAAERAAGTPQQAIYQQKAEEYLERAMSISQQINDVRESIPLSGAERERRNETNRASRRARQFANAGLMERFTRMGGHVGYNNLGQAARSYATAVWRSTRSTNMFAGVIDKLRIGIGTALLSVIKGVVSGLSMLVSPLGIVLAAVAAAGTAVWLFHDRMKKINEERQAAIERSKKYREAADIRAGAATADNTYAFDTNAEKVYNNLMARAATGNAKARNAAPIRSPQLKNATQFKDIINVRHQQQEDMQAVYDNYLKNRSRLIYGTENLDYESALSAHRWDLRREGKAKGNRWWHASTNAAKNRMFNQAAISEVAMSDNYMGTVQRWLTNIWDKYEALGSKATDADRDAAIEKMKRIADNLRQRAEQASSLADVQNIENWTVKSIGNSKEALEMMSARADELIRGYTGGLAGVLSKINIQLKDVHGQLVKIQTPTKDDGKVDWDALVTKFQMLGIQYNDDIQSRIGYMYQIFEIIRGNADLAAQYAGKTFGAMFDESGGVTMADVEAVQKSFLGLESSVAKEKWYRPVVTWFNDQKDGVRTRYKNADEFFDKGGWRTQKNMGVIMKHTLDKIAPKIEKPIIPPKKTQIDDDNNVNTNTNTGTSDQSEYDSRYKQALARPTQIIFNIDNLCNFSNTQVHAGDKEQLISSIEKPISEAVAQIFGMMAEQMAAQQQV